MLSRRKCFFPLFIKSPLNCVTRRCCVAQSTVPPAMCLFFIAWSLQIKLPPSSSFVGFMSFLPSRRQISHPMSEKKKALRNRLRNVEAKWRPRNTTQAFILPYGSLRSVFPSPLGGVWLTCFGQINLSYKWGFQITTSNACNRTKVRQYARHTDNGYWEWTLHSVSTGSLTVPLSVTTSRTPMQLP